MVEECEELGGVDWEWQAADCALGKARLGPPFLYRSLEKVPNRLLGVRNHYGEVLFFPGIESRRHVGDVGVAHGFKCLP